MENIRIRQYKEADLLELIRIWNQVVKDGHYEDICPYYLEL